ncbi:conserved hypothetical protein [Denitrovibrio acetiphilus DSM 12809]|uniref:PAS fold-4 domain-containing protein n=1 Tax=Denitrovibrio acetiphilus (strain DSM 12809 / NBRC 114555 / N2460) TaxID=522772 RepID=D4H1Q8_DENA2|nr:hypothetical protein [Denitrovibrio acetiphilus]ADD68818.1 conserved hypothetical protein [Denitrovibrio acetiphilus DSM 12809]
MENKNTKTEEQVLEAFHMMWDEYPSPVMLLSRRHDIITVNKAANTMGIPKGIKCHELTPGVSHAKYCRAAEALKTKTATRAVCKLETTEQVIDSYWIPVHEGGGYLLHFGNDITEYADDSLFA